MSHGRVKFTELSDDNGDGSFWKIIPTPVRSILDSFYDYNQDMLFQRKIIPCLKNCHNWDDIVKAINDSMKHYDDLVDSIQTGLPLVLLIIIF